MQYTSSRDFCHLLISRVNKSWKDLESFEASTTLTDKFWRGMNIVLIPSTVYSVYALATGAVLVPQIVCCICIALAVRKIVSTLIGYVVYPATVMFSKNSCNQTETPEIAQLERKGYIVKKIPLTKGGTTYDARLIAHSSTVDNGKWSMHAFGNGMCMEQVLFEVAEANSYIGCNTLLINGPAVGFSGGFPTRYQFGAGYEAGLQLLEKEVKATHIIFKGLSLGGGMISEGVLQHDFTEGLINNVKYLAVSDRSFSYLSEAAGAMVGRAVKPIFYLTGTELDGLGAARKLDELKIKQIVIQNEGVWETDGVIPNSAGMAAPLRKDSKHKSFVLSPQIAHNGPLPGELQIDLGHQLTEFLKL